MAKVYVGNLSFKTREVDLAHHFETAGKVARATIVCRGPRSLGFGFVDYENADEANNAVKLLNAKELDGRQLVVEVARTTGPTAPRPRQPPMQMQAQAGAPVTGAPANTTAAPTTAGGPTPTGAGARPPRQPRMMRGPMRNNMYGYPAPPPRGMFPPQMMRMPQWYSGVPNQQPMMPMMNMGMNMPMGGMNAMGMNPRKRRNRPARRRAPQWPVTKATMYVGNLPFVVEDENLKEIFKGLNVKDTHVCKSANGRSLGYGFVEFESEAARDHALNTLDKVEVENRVLVIKPANLPPPMAPVQGAVQPTNPTTAAATTATATTATTATTSAPATTTTATAPTTATTAPATTPAAPAKN